MAAKIFIKKNTIKSSTIKRIAVMNRRTLPGKSLNLVLLNIKAKTNTYTSNENIEFGLKNMTVIRSIHFKESFYVISKEKKFSLSNIGKFLLGN